MKKILFGLQILFLALAFPHNGEASEGILKYNDWSASSSENTAEYLVNGNTVHGHEFGFLKMAGNCNTDILWVSLSTYEKEMKNLEGIDATIQLRVGATKFQIEVPLVHVGELVPGLNILFFTNFVAGEAMISLLETEQQIEVTIVSPKRLARKFDIPTDSFSLNGFTAARLKARELCKGLTK